MAAHPNSAPQQRTPGRRTHTSGGVPLRRTFGGLPLAQARKPGQRSIPPIAIRREIRTRNPGSNSKIFFRSGTRRAGAASSRQPWPPKLVAVTYWRRWSTVLERGDTEYRAAATPKSAGFTRNRSLGTTPTYRSAFLPPLECDTPTPAPHAGYCRSETGWTCPRRPNSLHTPCPPTGRTSHPSFRPSDA